MSSTQNRITYIEPNNLPGEFAAKSNGVKVDNITWAPEDLNISVDLQVVIPSRIYRKSNNTDAYTSVSSSNKKISILTGQELKKDKNFLTDDYTLISFQEIKNNHEGSKEMLGINSIHISFDSHMYPRVTMNFTDVRGASLMMPQEYNENSKNVVCTSFFESFFKFPYPRFLLSVKGIYGTCVGFVLSVEDFKATFNSETGNFDVVVTFIGLMYGLYTDIPMNYLIMAPYIGSTSDDLTNPYWASKTKQGGEFFFKEKDGTESSPICTFFEFRNNYKNLMSLLEGKDDFVYGANIMAITKMQEEILALTKLKDCFNAIEDNCSPDVGTDAEVFTFSTENNAYHVIFLTGEVQGGSLSFNKNFVDDFKAQLDSYNEKYDSITFSTGDVPAKLSIGDVSVDTINSKSGSFFIYDNQEYKFKSTGSSFYDYFKGKDEVIGKIENTINNPNISSQIQQCGCAVVYDDTFKNRILERLSQLNEDINSLEEVASEEMQKLFREACNFTPTVENIMRMIFAHLDTFLYEFYNMLETIGKKDRILGKDVKWDITETDIQSFSSNPTVPPFTAFYKNRSTENEKIIYPGEDVLLKNLEEVSFVEDIFSGLEGKLKDEAAKAQGTGSTRDGIPDLYGDGSKFTPIAITDYYYYLSSPYSKISEYVHPYYFLTFVLNRLYVGFRDFEDSKTREKIVNFEFENLKSSSIWNRILNDDRFKNITINEFKDCLLANEDDESSVFSFLDRFRKKNNFHSDVYQIVLKQKNGDFFKFDGLRNLRGDNSLYKSYVRTGLDDRFKIATADEVDRIERFRASMADEETELNFLKSRIDDDRQLRRQGENGRASILQYLNEGKPIAKDINSSDYVPYNTGDTKNKIWICNETDIKTGNKGSTNIDQLLDEKSANNCWVPCIIDVDKTYNIFFNVNNGTNPLFLSEEVSDEIKALWFIVNTLVYMYVSKEKIDFKTDHIYHFPKLVLYYIGGYFSICDNQYNKGKDNYFITIITNISNLYGLTSFIPNFLTDKTNLKELFKSWTKKEFNSILTKIKNGEEGFQYEVWSEYIKGGYNHSIKALSPGTELQTELIKLIQDDCWVFSFPNTKEKNKVGEVLLEIDEKYFNSFFDKIQKELNNSSNGQEAVEESNKTDNTIQASASNNDKLSLYITLKNLYDRWLSTYSHNNFKLKGPNDTFKRRDRSVYSEFDNFLYVDSFYNNIGSEFIINPKSFFNIVNDQIAGTTNYNILEFIGKICQENKLLFRCLPVYDNLYSEETFKDIFRPLSLYNGADKLHRRIGNTYLLMYTYEPSNKLNLPQDKTNDASYKDDSFVFVDSNGNITKDAARLFNGKGENICAFSVTPGMQNQSYFTKVSIGMDNPRVTDISIRNKFALADSVNGGRTEGVGVGQDLFSLYSNRSYDCNVEMLGCANIMPMMYFQLNNVPMFKGAYMITKVEHNIQNNTMTTKFTGTRLSRYAIPFNKSLFSLVGLSEIINRLLENGTKNKINIGYIDVEITGDGEVKKTSYIGDTEYGEDYYIPQPTGEAAKAIDEFNVWAAVNQMAQCAIRDGGAGYSPLTQKFNDKLCGKCASSVYSYIMAGFNGLFCANSKQQAREINDNFRKSGLVKLDNRQYYGRSGYDLKYDLSDYGFVCIAAGETNIDQTELRVGDVCVMKSLGTDNSGNSYVGHVCMYDGKEWVSDHLQVGKFSGYQGWRTGWWWKNTNNRRPTNDAGVLLYRYPNIVSKKEVYGYYKDGVWITPPDKIPPQGIPEKKNAVET